MTRKLVALLAITVAGLAAAASVQAQTWVAGKHYSVIPTQRTNVPAGKVEVMEVFSYGCPACNSFLPTMKKLKAALPANAQLVYLPASWNKAENWPLFQRAYLTAQSLGVAEKAHEGMFQAIWTTGELGVTEPSGRPQENLPSIEDAARFYQRATGVKAADFVNASKSFSVDLKMRQADSQIIAMQVPSTPTLVVNGKYRVNNDDLTPDRLIELVKFLVAKESGRSRTGGSGARQEALTTLRVCTGASFDAAAFPEPSREPDEKSERDNCARCHRDEVTDRIHHDEIRVARVEAVEIRERRGQRFEISLAERQRTFVRMKGASARECFSVRREFDMRAEHVRHRLVLEEFDGALGTRAIVVDVVDEQAARQQEIAGEDDAGARVVEQHVFALVARHGQHLDLAIAEIDLRGAVGPVFETKERVHPGRIERDHFRRRQRGELRIAGAMIAVAVRMDHEQREPRAIDDRQQAGHRLGERHALRVFDGATVDEQGAFGADEQI